MPNSAPAECGVRGARPGLSVQPCRPLPKGTHPGFDGITYVRRRCQQHNYHKDTTIVIVAKRLVIRWLVSSVKIRLLAPGNVQTAESSGPLRGCSIVS